MTDHSCPTCDGGWIHPMSERAHPSGCRCDGSPCPDCIEGYPKDRIERAAKAMHQEMTRRSSTNLSWEAAYPEEQADFINVTVLMIRAFHH